MQSQSTGYICRNEILQSNIHIDGFNWKQGARYITMNLNLTGDTGVIKHLLPWTKSGAKLTMKNKAINSKTEIIENEWEFRKGVSPTEQESKELIARVAEIGLRTIFEKFCYRFGGKVFIQMKGGPIGARVTMACARLVMVHWGRMVQSSLSLSIMEITLFS